MNQPGLSIARQEASNSATQIPAALSALAHSGITLFITPEAQIFHEEVEENASEKAQPVQPELDQLATELDAVLSANTLTCPPSLSLAEKIASAAYMIQFTDYLPEDREVGIAFTYEEMADLKTSFTRRSSQGAKPLDFAQQLDAALELYGGDITKSLTNLCFISRQFARWHDTRLIEGLPEFEDAEIIKMMAEWRSLVLACKPYNSTRPQDPAGDTYYAWTHALAQTIFGVDGQVHDHIGRRVFSRGTDIMHTVVHSVNKQRVPSDHRIAARYGNYIGRRIIKSLG